MPIDSHLKLTHNYEEDRIRSDMDYSPPETKGEKRKRHKRYEKATKNLARIISDYFK